MTHNGLSLKGGIYPRGFSASVQWRWPLVKSADLVTLNYGKALRAGDRKAGQVPVYGTNGQCGWHDTPLVRGPGVILGRKGQGPLGVEWCDSGYWVIDTAYFVTLKSNDFDLRYFYNLVKYIGLNHLKDGTSNPSLSRDTFADLLLPLPPLREQRAIASILGALDDKIELNRRMNETLESLSRAIFKSWFVDFDPVRAKMDGRQPPGMDQATADLFPDALVHREGELVPAGWKAGSVKDEFNLTMGQSPPGSTYNEAEEGLPFFQGRRDFGFRFPSRRVYCTVPTRFADAGDSLVSVRAPVGDLNMALERCCIGRGVAAVRHRTGSRSYTYYSMQNLKADFARYEAEGTVFGSINKKNFESIKLIIPGARLVKAFDKIATPIDQRIANQSLQSETLAALRDTLLPKLLSGELRVPEAFAAAEEALR